MKDKFQEILNNHGIYGEDVDNVLNAVHDMLILMADKTKAEYPYATNSIKKLEDSAYEVFNLIWEL